MKLSISIYDLISWMITIVSVMLFLFERKKNNRLPYYMAIQGILRACKTKAGFYSARLQNLRSRNSAKNSAVTKEEYILFTETVYSDFAALMEHIMGSLKAIEPERDMKFDTMDFTSSHSPEDSKQEKA